LVCELCLAFAFAPEIEMNKELAKSIGTAARQARKALQLTQEDAAERIDVSVEFYARIERGISLPSILTFARIVSSLGVSADIMLGRQQPSVVQTGISWTPAPPDDSQEIRRLVRRLRQAQPGTLRLVNLILKEIESQPLETLDSELERSDSELDSALERSDSELERSDSEVERSDSEGRQSPVAPTTMAPPHEPLFRGMRPVSDDRSVIAARPMMLALAE
jgi:transcriptional regulator with XRE-family HTH domain